MHFSRFYGVAASWQPCNVTWTKKYETYQKVTLIYVVSQHINTFIIICTRSMYYALWLETWCSYFTWKPLIKDIEVWLLVVSTFPSIYYQDTCIESAIQIFVRACVRGFFRDFPRNVVFWRKLPIIFFHAVFLDQQSGHVKGFCKKNDKTLNFLFGDVLFIYI